ncbi:hypothetical protein R2A130_0006 [Ahrensia sp. R2A130]|nr:hypothetical protein R2A130_0006 [Ahrensia sp. R2A130]
MIQLRSSQDRTFFTAMIDRFIPSVQITSTAPHSSRLNGC